MKRICVKAAPLADPALSGKARVVKEGTRHRYITEDEPIEVDASAYYLRKLSSGELMLIPPSGNPPPRVRRKRETGGGNADPGGTVYRDIDEALIELEQQIEKMEDESRVANDDEGIKL